MSIFVAELLPSGIVFAADKNITISRIDARGRTIAAVQDLGSKILRWPRSKALLGYVGCATVGNQGMYEWLYDFIGDHVGFADPAAVAKDLRRRLQEGLGPHPEITVVQFATFTTRGGFIVPEFWHITNSPELTPEGEYIRTDRFVASERLLGVHLIGQATPENVRQFLQDRAAAFSPFWFHQGFNLAVFNTVTEAVRRAFEALQGGGLVGPPQTLGDWERYAKLWVLTYGAYFEAFGNPGERYVGGGADVLSIPWPDDV